ncbi:hypothetical protein [Endozoicomonas acroporae]|uniref:hypothetical protein n=1 Tax=Endozoicomonas acroporae TaxID=1701104 RepID=UPI003D7B6866
MKKSKKNKDQFYQFPVSRNNEIIHMSLTFMPSMEKSKAKKKGNLKVVEPELVYEKEIRKVERTYKYPYSTLTVTQPDNLITKDESIMHAIFAIARSTEKAEFSTYSENSILYAVGLGVTELPILILKTNMVELMRAAGLNNNGDDIKFFQDSISRLSDIKFSYRSNGKKPKRQSYKNDFWGDFNLLHVHKPEGSKDIYIYINSVTSRSIRETGYTLVALPERHRLKNDIEKNLHSYFSCFVSRPKSDSAYKKTAPKSYKIDDLIIKIYGIDSITDLSRRDLYNKRQSIIKALTAISNLEGWEIAFYGDKPSNRFIKVKRKPYETKV